MIPTFKAAAYLGDVVLLAESLSFLVVPASDGLDDDFRMKLGWSYYCPYAVGEVCQC